MENRKTWTLDCRANTLYSVVARIPDWLIHSVGPPFVALVQAAWWPDLQSDAGGPFESASTLGAQLVSGVSPGGQGQDLA